jgi:hypothetical protein
MTASVPVQEAMRVMQTATGVVIPVHLPEDTDTDVGQGLVRDTVEGFLRQCGREDSVCLTADGAGVGTDLVRELSREHAVSTVYSESSHGKLHAVRLAMAVLLKKPELRYIVVADQDGDHFPNELLNFVRGMLHVEAVRSTDRAMVLGRRISRHRPMGFARGELEELADRVTLDALAYRAAATGRPLSLEFVTPLDEFPDFHSGYKLFTRATAEAVFAGEPRLAGVSEDAYFRHACEAVMSVEAVESGAVLATLNRSTADEQPVSTFGLLNRLQLVADKMIWPCRRLEIPGRFVSQWLDNHMPRLLMGTLLPDGRDEILRIRQKVLEAFPPDDGGAAAGPLDDIVRMPFI